MINKKRIIIFFTKELSSIVRRICLIKQTKTVSEFGVSSSESLPRQHNLPPTDCIDRDCRRKEWRKNDILFHSEYIWKFDIMIQILGMLASGKWCTVNMQYKSVYTRILFWIWMSFRFPNGDSRGERKNFVNLRIQVRNDFHRIVYARTGSRNTHHFPKLKVWLVHTLPLTTHCLVTALKSYTTFSISTRLPAFLRRVVRQGPRCELSMQTNNSTFPGPFTFQLHEEC